MIRGTHCNLRAVDRSDLDCLLRWLDDPEIMAAWGYGAPAISRDSVIRRIEAWLAEELEWEHPAAFVVETLDGARSGLIVLSHCTPIDRSCELSILLESASRGQGIGGAALDAIVDAAFSHWNLHRLTVHCEAHNTAAHAFFARQGFVPEGRLREARYFDGSWHDVLIFGRLPNTPERTE